MNREEILAMEAGRGLDELIEVNLFNLVRGYRNDGSRCWKNSDGLPVQSEAKPYSTNISVAWQVLDMVNRMGYGITITVFDPSQMLYPENKIEVEINDIHKPVTESTVIVKVLADELPEAICKAALLAKLEGVA